MSVSLTQEQKDAISARGRVIVSASAGSGKTFVMIERLVSLIADEGVGVKNVLCVTFTNKAAAQMRERLRGALVKKIAASGDGAARKRLKEQLNDLPLADICTIHAFCARLLRSRFYRVGLDPSFRIIGADDATGKAIGARALDEVFEQAYEEGGEEFESLLAVWFYKKRDKRLRGLVAALYEKARGGADTARVLGEVGAHDLFDRACETVERGFRRKIEYYRDSADAAIVYFAETNARAVKVAHEIKAACEALLSTADLFSMASVLRPAISSMPPSSKAEGEDKRILKALSYASKGIKGVYGELAAFSSREEEREKCENARMRAAALAALAKRYDETVSRMKTEQGVLDYDDLERYTIALLQDEETRRELQEKYRFLFVDEYQDVNPVQERILSALTGEEAFFVGDGKQAIYGFRGSRSEFFDQKTHELNALSLTRNFRSARAVINAVNRVFSKILTGYPLMTGGERYGEHEGDVQFHLIPEREKQEKTRGVYSVAESVGEEESDALSDEVVRLIEAERGALFYDVDAGRERTVGWGDIAVLVRKNTGDAERIVRALVSRGIPVTTSSKINVCDYFEARLLIDWLSLLDNARQDIPLGTALLSPVGGFTDGELAAIRLRFPSPYTFREACEKYRRMLCDPIAQKLAAFEERYARLRALCAVRTAAEMMNELLSAGLERQIAQKGSVQARLSHVQRLIAEAADDGVHEFLARLKALSYRVDFCESGGENAVKVHTMHASKGLEYPVVILAGLDASFHGVDKDELMWTEEFYAAPKSYDVKTRTVSENMLRLAAQAAEEEKQLIEEKNLLYVAMTRAQYRLHMLFAGKEAIPAQFASRFSDFIDLHETADYFTEGGSLPPPKRRSALAGKHDETLSKTIENLYAVAYPHAAATVLPVKSSATALMREEENEERAHFTGKGFSKEEGVAYHLFLQNVTFGADAEEEFARMRRAGILTEEQAALIDLAQLKKILAIPCLASLAGKRIFREQTFLVRLSARETGVADCDDELIFQGAIDLLVEDEQGFTVVDYKYSGKDERDIVKSYAVQINLYKKAVARTMRVREESVRARIVNIASGREIVL